MKLTPLDIRKQEFRKVWHGLDPLEVKAFLEMVSAEMESLVKDRNALQEEITRLRESLEELKQKEALLNEALISAQRLAQEVKGQAEKEASLITEEARLRANQVFEEARRQASEVKATLGQLLDERDRILYELRSFLDNQLKLLDQRGEELARQRQMLRQVEEAAASLWARPAKPHPEPPPGESSR